MDGIKYTASHCNVRIDCNKAEEVSYPLVNYSDLQKSELPASVTTALATMLRNTMSYTMSTGV